MRLICPNCGAQYEVAEDVIPAGGRDVQCSNCGHTWFEEPGASERAERAAMEQAEEPQAALPKREPEPEPEIEPEPEAEPEAEPEQEPEPEPATKAREIDPKVADILREEAAFEQAARRSEAQPIETQPDLGLDDSQDDEDQRSREARDRLARLRGEPERRTAAAIATTVAADAPRRELLPDIEEINSTLRSDTSRTQANMPTIDAPEPHSGFRRGFMSVAVAALLGLGVYVGSDRIIAAVPATQGPITSYVGWIDGMRIWLNDQMQSLADERAAQDGTAPTEAGSDG